MTSRGYGLDVTIEGKDLITKALRTAGSTVQRTAQTMNRSLETSERRLESMGRAAQNAANRMRQNLAGGMQRGAAAARNFGASMSRVGTSLTMGVTLPLAAVGLAFAKFNDVASSLQAEAQFRKQAEGIGASFEGMMASVRAATGGIVDDTTLQQRTTRAMALGVGKDMEQISKLWAIARVNARELGGTTEDAFNSMVQTIAQGSADALNSQGFALRSDQIFRQYAETAGVVAAELDQETRSQLVLNAVLKQAEQRLRGVDLAAVDEAESLRKMQAELSNTTDNLLRNLLPVLETTLKAFNALPGPVKTAVIAMLGLALVAGPVASGLGAIVQGSALAVKGLLALARSQRVAAISSRILGMSMRSALIASGIGILIVALGLLLQAFLENWGGIREKTAAAIDFIKQHLDKILLFLGPAGWIIFGLKQLAGGWGELWQGIKDTTDAIVNPIIDIINGLIDAMNKVPGVDIGRVGNLGGRAAETAPIPDAHQGAMIRRGGLANVLRGEAILSPGHTRQMLGGGGRVINVTNHFHGLVVHDESDIDAIAARMRASLEGVR